MNRHWQLILAAVVAPALLWGCRTNINPVKQPEKPDVYVAQGGCDVRHFPNATDVPEGAKNLGWVAVEIQGSDEETYDALHQKICQLGGDALSSLHWEKSSTETTAQRVELQAMGWTLP